MSHPSASHQNSGQSTGRKFLWGLWVTALVVSAINLLAITRRIQIMGARLPARQEQAARFLAHTLNALPAHTHSLLLLSHHDPVAPWIDYRINYFVYPRRCDGAWDALPQGASQRYDQVLAYDTAQTLLPAGWTAVERGIQASWFVPVGQNSPRKALAHSGPPRPDSWPQRVGSNLMGIASIAGIMLLSLLLLARTMRLAPFDVWWGNLAVAHLVGATALAWLAGSLAMVAGRLLIWPVYLVLALLLLPPRQPYDTAAPMLPSRWRQAGFGHTRRWPNRPHREAIRPWPGGRRFPGLSAL